jgi:hypothetical protein
MARDWLLIALLVGCGKSSEPTHDQRGSGSAVVTSPECAQKVKELTPWLEQIEVEQASHEIDFGYQLQVIDRAPLPLPRKIDIVMIKATSFDAYDLAGSEHMQVELVDVPSQTELDTALAAMFATKPDASDKSLPPADLLRIDVDIGAPWSDVVRTVDSATKAGYARVLFAFTATSTLVAPVGIPREVTSADEMSKVDRRLEQLGETECKPLGHAALHHEWNPDRAANARAVARETADAIAACNCAATPEEFRALRWQDAHWHQAVIRTPITVALSGSAPIEIAIAKAMPWSDAHAQLLAADGHAIKLVAK